MLLVLLVPVSYLGSGLAVLRALAPRETYPPLLRLLVAFFSGALVHVAILKAFALCGVVAHAIPWALTALGIMALVFEGVLFCLARRRLAFRITPLKGMCSWGNIFLWAGFALLLFFPLRLVALRLMGLPDVEYDSTAFWNLKATLFFYGDGIWSEAFTDPARIHAHKSYPLYGPLTRYEQYVVLGHPDDYLTKPAVWIYHMAGLLLFFALVKRAAGPRVGLIATATLVYIPVLSYRKLPGSITSTYLDFPLAIMILASVGFISGLRHRRTTDVVGASVGLYSAALLKNEGLSWFAVGAATVVFAGYRFGFRPRRKDLLILLLPLPLVLAQLYLLAVLPASVDATWPQRSQIAQLPEALLTVMIAWAKSLGDFDRWSFFPIVVLSLFGIGLVRCRRAPELWLAIALVIQLAIGLCVMALAGIQKGSLDRYLAVTYPRLIIHVLPTTFLLAIMMNLGATDTEHPESKTDPNAGAAPT